MYHKDYCQAVFYLLMRQPSQINASLRDTVHSLMKNDKASLLLKLYCCTAFILRGDQFGYTYLKSLISDHSSCVQILPHFDETIAKNYTSLAKE